MSGGVSVGGNVSGEVSGGGNMSAGIRVRVEEWDQWESVNVSGAVCESQSGRL